MNTPRLNVLLLSNYPYYYNTVLDDALKSHPHVTVAKQRRLARQDLVGLEVNVLLIDPRVARDHSDIEEFIRWAQKERGEVRCVFFGPEGVLGNFFRDASDAFRDYFRMILEDDEGICAAKPSLVNMLDQCRVDWIGYWAKKCRYDVALSYANADAEFVSNLVRHLKARGIRVFDYNTTPSERLGEDLRKDTERIYGPDSRYCVLVASEAHRDSFWCTKEADVALQTLKKGSGGYSMPFDRVLSPAPVAPPGRTPGRSPRIRT